jgi:Tfp pilus assembly protein PilZ
MGAGKPLKKWEQASIRSEQRIARRAKRRVMVRFGEKSADRMAFTKNLSETGLFMQTNFVVKPGTVLSVELHFPDRKFSMWARVVWAKRVPPQLAHVLECGMGICFLEPTPDWLSFFRDWSRSVGAR